MENRKSGFKYVSLTIFILVIVLSMSLTACSLKDKAEETDYFIYMDMNGDYVSICGLTKKGQEQKYLIIPKEIKGIEVTELNDRRYIKTPAKFNSQVLEKAYFMNSYYINAKFFECPNLKKFIYQGSSRWVLPNGGIAYYKAPVYFRNRVSSSDQLPANVSFVLNFLTDDIEDYYWVDDIENGEKIEIIPDEPKREGYLFDGWFKESECVNPWNFDKDTVTKVEFFDDTPQEGFVETKLYAKWIKT